MPHCFAESVSLFNFFRPSFTVAPSFRKPFRSSNPTGNRFNKRGGQRGPRFGGIRGAKKNFGRQQQQQQQVKKKTPEELDRELDLYMKKDTGKHPHVEPPI
jgi:hypothetical protein